MSILIKGMEMPTSCLSCDFCNPFTDTPYCRRLMKITPISTRLDDCPLVPVPPHGDLIERNAASLTDFEIVLCNGNFREGMKMLLDKIDNAPTIIEAEDDDG